MAQTQTADIKLEVGAVTEQVVVSDAGGYWNPAPPKLAGTSPRKSTRAGRSWSVTDSGRSRVHFRQPARHNRRFVQGSINGGQQYSHEILIEGMPIGRADLSGGNNNEFSPSAEAIGEFKLQTGAIGAQYNGGQTAVANFTIRSGTNELHGSGILLRPERSVQRRESEHDDGGRQESQIPRTQLRLFARRSGFHPEDLRRPQQDILLHEPRKGRSKPAAVHRLRHGAHRGIQEGRLFEAVRSGLHRRSADPARRSERTPWAGRSSSARFTILPRRGRVGDAIVRDPFRRQHHSRRSSGIPVAKNIIQKIGIQDPTLPTLLRNIPTINGQPVFHLHTWGVKIDHQINSKNQLSGYYNHSYRSRYNNGAGRFLPFPGPASSSWQQQITPGHLARLSLTSTISPRIINRAAAGFNRFLNQNGAYPTTINADLASAIGLQNLPGTMFPVIQFNGPGSALQGNSIARMGVGFADTSPNGSWIFQDDLTWLHGSHSFHFGYEYKRYFYNDRALSDAGNVHLQRPADRLAGPVDEHGQCVRQLPARGGVQRESRHSGLFAGLPPAAARRVLHGRLEDHAAADRECRVCAGKSSRRSTR